MASPIQFFIDFASPYSYFALDPMARLAAEHGRPIELRPFLLWAVLKHHGVANPIENPARRTYFMHDVVRSAAFHGVPFKMPEPLQISAHLATRLFYALAEDGTHDPLEIARQIYRAFFVSAAPITDAAVLAKLPCVAGRSADQVRDVMNGQIGRDRLAQAIDGAIAAGVIGAPFVVVDGEGFFGADRLPQIGWRLQSTKVA